MIAVVVVLVIMAALGCGLAVMADEHSGLVEVGATVAMASIMALVIFGVAIGLGTGSN